MPAHHHKNGTTSSGTQRWRCTHCGHTFTNPNVAKTNAYRLAIFIDWITGQRPLNAVAAAHNVSRRTLIRWFTFFWFIIVPCKPDPYRVYDQLFIDGTYFHKKCLLVAATSDHVVAWHWCTRETAYDYAKLFDLIAEPSSSPQTAPVAHTKPPNNTGQTPLSNAASSTCDATPSKTPHASQH